MYILGAMQTQTAAAHYYNYTLLRDKHYPSYVAVGKDRQALCAYTYESLYAHFVNDLYLT